MAEGNPVFPTEEHQEIGALFLCLKLTPDKGFNMMSFNVKCVFILFQLSLLSPK
jgi:hypothetical protein